MKHVVVIGGGIAGLACAHALHRRARVTLLESADRLGGVIGTDRWGGFLVERGPDSFFAGRPGAADLCRALGIETIPARSGRVHILSGNRLHELPEGMAAGVPTKIRPLLTTRLISAAGKIRMALDLVLPRGRAEDESLGGFIRRRLGREALDRLAEPLLAAIHSAPADRLSLRSAFPSLFALERDHRSLILGLRRMNGSAAAAMAAPRGGMAEIVERLAGFLRSEDVRTGCNVEAVTPLDGSWSVRFNGDRLAADEVVLAIPAPRAAALVRSTRPDFAESLLRIPYGRSTTVSLGFRGRPPVEGSGAVIRRSEGRRLSACTFSSQKFEGRAPRDHWLVRCFFKDAPADPVETARREFAAAFGVPGEPVLARAGHVSVERPIYEVGHRRRVAEIKARAPRGIHVTGSAYSGAGVPDCIVDAQRTAERALASA